MGQFFQFKPNMWKQYVDEYHKDVHNTLKEILYRKAISKDRKNKTKTGLKSKIKNNKKCYNQHSIKKEKNNNDCDHFN